MIGSVVGMYPKNYYKTSTRYRCGVTTDRIFILGEICLYSKDVVISN